MIGVLLNPVLFVTSTIVMFAITNPFKANHYSDTWHEQTWDVESTELVVKKRCKCKCSCIGVTDKI